MLLAVVAAYVADNRYGGQQRRQYNKKKMDVTHQFHTFDVMNKSSRATRPSENNYTFTQNG